MAAKFEPGIGTVDGVNKTFYTSEPYQAGTLVFLLNGQAKVRENDDGWFDTDPATGRVDLKEAPLPGDPDEPADDVVQFFYIPAADALAPVSDTAYLLGRPRKTHHLKATLRWYPR